MQLSKDLNRSFVPLRQPILTRPSSANHLPHNKPHVAQPKYAVRKRPQSAQARSNQQAHAAEQARLQQQQQQAQLEEELAATKQIQRPLSAQIQEQIQQSAQRDGVGESPNLSTPSVVKAKATRPMSAQPDLAQTRPLSAKLYDKIQAETAAESPPPRPQSAMGIPGEQTADKEATEGGEWVAGLPTHWQQRAASAGTDRPQSAPNQADGEEHQHTQRLASLKGLNDTVTPKNLQSTMVDDEQDNKAAAFEDEFDLADKDLVQEDDGDSETEFDQRMAAATAPENLRLARETKYGSARNADSGRSQLRPQSAIRPQSAGKKDSVVAFQPTPEASPQQSDAAQRSAGNNDSRYALLRLDSQKTESVQATPLSSVPNTLSSPDPNSSPEAEFWAPSPGIPQGILILINYTSI